MTITVDKWPGYKRLILAVVDLALRDASGDIPMTAWRKRTSIRRMVNEARRFINGNWCEELCYYADIDYDKVRETAENYAKGD